MKKIFFFIVLIDYLTKAFAKIILKTNPISLFSFLDLVYVENRGVSFGLFSNFVSPLIMGIITAIISICIFVYMLKKPKTEQYGFLLILSGATGNIIDRFLEGYVIDFINFHLGKYAFPAFNIADISIFLGVCWLLILEFNLFTAQKFHFKNKNYLLK